MDDQLKKAFVPVETSVDTEKSKTSNVEEVTFLSRACQDPKLSFVDVGYGYD